MILPVHACHAAGNSTPPPSAASLKHSVGAEPARMLGRDAYASR